VGASLRGKISGYAFSGWKMFGWKQVGLQIQPSGEKALRGGNSIHTFAGRRRAAAQINTVLFSILTASPTGDAQC
jgi:hypothetical protein